MGTNRSGRPGLPSDPIQSSSLEWNPLFKWPLPQKRKNGKECPFSNTALSRELDIGIVPLREPRLYPIRHQQKGKPKRTKQNMGHRSRGLGECHTHMLPTLRALFDVWLVSRLLKASHIIFTQPKGGNLVRPQARGSNKRHSLTRNSEKHPSCFLLGKGDPEPNN